ncbi:Dockerin domain-containing protein [Desulfonema magnum]|uniref:Dockerin domain-containing protein n=2 Tax=Desulfonema magnum TaxID=45655 RepID=A0A975GRE4_9BACT|nr:Dockerin domain-containing protein [Desulfonema magnum]
MSQADMDAECETGCYLCQSVVCDDPPADPSGLTASAVSETEITLSWTDNSDDETGFKIYRGGELITTAAANATSHGDTGLTCGTNYDYQVIATNDAGDSSPVSASGSTFPCPPSGLTAQAVSETEITLSWTDNSDDETGFKIYRGDELITTAATGATSYNDTGLACGTGYDYQVVATNDVGDSSGASASGITAACPASPSAPSDLTAQAVSETEITLSWTDNSDDETGFKIYRGGELITTAATGATSYNDTGLACGTGYDYQVVATNDVDDSSAVSASGSTANCGSDTPSGMTSVYMGGQDRFYVDMNGIEGIQEESDPFAKLFWVRLENAGDDSGKYALIARGYKELKKGDFDTVLVLDGDVDGDGKFHIHESDRDVTYLDDDNNEMTIKTFWEHIGEEGSRSNCSGYLHSAVLDMSDSENPFSGYNKYIVRIEHGATMGENIIEAGITIEYNDEGYADTITYNGGGLIGNVLTNIGQNFITEYVEKDGKKTAITHQFSVKGNICKLHIPLADDGAFNITDGLPDGLTIKGSMQPRRDPDSFPAWLPGTAGSLQIDIQPETAMNSGAKWQVDGGEWQESSTIVTGLREGVHTVTFSRLSGWFKPADQTVSITAGETSVLTGTYQVAQGSGSLTVEIHPSQADSAGAMWNLDDGEWQESGHMVSNLDAGDYVVNFKKISGWLTPESVPAAVNDAGDEIVTGNYLLYGDADGNGEISLGDMVVIQKVLVGMKPDLPERLEVADVSSDGVLGMTDSFIILQYILGMKSSLEPAK